MDFYGRVTELCESQGITVNALIVKLGMSKSNGKSWRTGAVPQIATLKRIAEYFGVTVEYLRDGITDDSTVEVQHINDNHGIIGKVNAPVSFNAQPPAQDDLAATLLEIYNALSPMDKARLLVYADNLKNNSL